MSGTDSREGFSVHRRALLASASAVLTMAIEANATASAQEGSQARAADLERLFASPPPEARPGVVWHWYNGLVTREGISADIDAMADAGIGRALLFSVSLGSPVAPGVTPVRSLTPEWWALIEHAFECAARRGIEIGFTICDGWATAAGPWITPETSMQRLTHSEIFAMGGQPITRAVPAPPSIENYYRDLRVVAFKIPDLWETSLTRVVAITSSYDAGELSVLNSVGAGELIIDSDQPGWIQYSFDRPFTVRGATAEGAPSVDAGAGLELHASEDGVTFARVGVLAQPRLAPVSLLEQNTHAQTSRINSAYSIEGAAATTARHFRIVFAPIANPPQPSPIPFDGLKGDPEVAPPAARLRLSRLILTDQQLVPRINERNGQAWALPEMSLDDQSLPRGACIDRSAIVDLTALMHDDGTLHWTPPDRGVWKVVRIGHTSTGRVNETAQAGGKGLECDKLRADVVRLQFSGWFAEVARRLDRAGAGRSLRYLNIDSWECGSQNWSPALPAAFLEKRGYNIEPHLPLLVGMPLDSAETTDRVLRDFRRTIAECVQENFFGELAHLTRSLSCKIIAQPADPVFPVDPLARAAHADMPMGEFWVKGDDKPFDVAGAIHGGHVYGRRLVTAEAFTQFGMQWNETPWTLKAIGDANWAKGINHFHCHVFPSQPWIDEAHKPGMTLSHIGSFMCRTNTWWPLAKSWFDYMQRSQALLQQGLPVVDLCYFIGEDIPARAYVPSTVPIAAPAGYSFDSINADALMRLVRVEDGDIVLPHGQRYRVLVLPSGQGISLRLLDRLRQLARAGATIVGAPPRGSSGFDPDGRVDRGVVRRAREMWGPLFEGGYGVHTFGRGRVAHVEDLSEILRDRAGGPDFLLETPHPEPDQASSLMWSHRAGPDWDFYFLSSQSTEPQTVRARFRVQGKRPEIFRADTGTIEALAAWTEHDGAISAEIPLEACGSAFVVFRAAADDAVARADMPEDALLLRRGNEMEAASSYGGEVRIERSSGSVVRRVIAAAPAPIACSGPWTIRFNEGTPQEKRLVTRALRSWTLERDPDIRAYAGLASYETRISLSSEHLSEDLQWMLDLGDVAELCQVAVNGAAFPALWKPPFLLDVTRSLIVGDNVLRVVVANTWRNRLITDGPRASGDRESFTAWPFFPRGAEPPVQSPSGFDADGLFFGGGFGNDARFVPRRGSPAGTPPPTRRGLSRYGFPGGGASAPGPAPTREIGPDGLADSGLLGPVVFRARRVIVLN